MSARPKAYLAHLTTATGHLRSSPRDEVDPASIALGRALLVAALAGAPARLPAEFPGCAITADRLGRGLLVTVTHTPADGAPEPLAVFGVATRGRDAHTLWPTLTLLHERFYPGTRLPAQPPAPWCAAVPMPGLLRHADAASWLGDFERVIAWAWLERGDG